MTTTVEVPKAEVVLSNSCMLVHLSISQWLGKRQDNRASEAGSAAFGAGKKAGIYSKHLVPPKALSSIVKAATALRAEHYRLTLPWLDGGARILSNRAFFPYQEALQKYRNDFEIAVSNFAQAYPRYIDEAQGVLGQLFDVMEYPRDILSKFSISCQILPLPESKDFRVEGLNGHLEEIRSSIQNAQEGIQEVARKEIATRVEACLGRIVERLRSYAVTEEGKIQNHFKDSLILNARELVELFPLLNVTADSALEALAAEIDAMAQVEPQSLRDDASVRASTADAAEEILRKMSAFL